MEFMNLDIYKYVETHLSDGDKQTLLDTLAKHKKYIYLEIGSYHGGSLQPALSDPNCIKTISIDKRETKSRDDARGEVDYFEVTEKQMRRNLYKNPHVNLQKLECHESDASDVELDTLVDVCFIDGEHTVEAATNDFYFCLTHLNEGGSVLFHDRIIVGEGIRKNYPQHEFIDMPDNMLLYINE